jgi:hypothetical protein
VSPPSEIIDQYFERNARSAENRLTAEKGRTDSLAAHVSDCDAPSVWLKRPTYFIATFLVGYSQE